MMIIVIRIQGDTKLRPVKVRIKVFELVARAGICAARGKRIPNVLITSIQKNGIDEDHFGG